MPIMVQRVAIFLFLATLTVAASPRAAAQQADAAAGKLAAARVKYEDEMEKIRDGVRDVLTKQEAALRAKAKPDEEALAKLASERSAFEASGAWPSPRPIRVLRQRQMKASALLDRAYQDAEKASAKAKNSELQAALQAERKQLPKEFDVVPWGDNLVEAPGSAGPSISPRNAPLAVGSAPSDQYRVEVLAHCADAGGTLIVECPLADGKRLPVSAVAMEKGQVRFLASIRDPLVCPDLGAARPLDSSGAIEGASRQIGVRSDRGTFVVDSVRLKPIPDGKPKIPPAGSAANRGQGAATDPMPVGSTWGGFYAGTTLDSIDMCNAVVRKRQGDLIELALEHEKVKMTWQLRLSGSTLSVVGVSAPGPARINESGTGEVTSETFSLDWSWDLRGHADQQRGTIQLFRDDDVP